MGCAYTVGHAAALAANLPYGSALRSAVDPSQEWSPTDYLLAAIEFDIRCLGYSGKGPKPKRVPTPADGARRAPVRASRAEMLRVASAYNIDIDS